ncbi:uncharacterized protein LOC144034205 [Vanacampus margaritifer]
MMLRAELDSLKLTQKSLQGNNEKVKYFTGLLNFKTLMLLFNMVSPFLCTKNIRIGMFERLLRTLVKLKLNVPVKDLGGRTSNRFITEQCDILSKLQPEGLVLSDRSFDISDSVGLHCAEINVPGFTREKPE